MHRGHAPPGEEAIYDDFVARLAAAGRGLRVGDPRAPGTVVGPLVSARARSASSATSPRASRGGDSRLRREAPTAPRARLLVEPTLFTGVRNDMVIAREEILAGDQRHPVFATMGEAIALANDSIGLYGYVWTRDPSGALRVARALRTGRCR